MSCVSPRAQLPVLAALPLVIDTPRLRLRPIVEHDVEPLWPHVSDPRVTPFVSWAAHRDREETRAFIRNANEALANGTDLVWVIEHDGAARGCVGLHGIRWQLRAWRVDRAELGYWIGASWWGQCLVTEAARAATHWAFATLGLHKLTVGCIEDNLGSRRVIEKVGFRWVGRQHADVWRGDRWWAHLRYELTADELASG